MHKTPYFEAIGALNWCSVSCRPDISFAVSHLASFASNPSTRHWNAVKTVGRYLKGTRDLGIVYKRGGGILEGWCDADWANDEDDRKSITGYCFAYAGGLISWSSYKQATVARSTMEAEFSAASDASSEAVWLHDLMADLRSVFPDLPTGPVPLSLDNKSAEAFIKRDLAHRRTRHIATNYHFTRNMCEIGKIKILHVPGTANPADVLTKPLPPSKHARALALANLCVSA